MQKNTQMSILDFALCNINNLVHQEHHRDYELWYDQNQEKQYCEYKLYGWPNDKQMETYQFRKDQKTHLVYVHYLTPVQNSGFKQFSVFIEKIHYVLSTLAKLSFVQGLYLIKNVLKGFHLLFERFGYVHIDDKLIGLNGQGKVKVWINQNFAFNGVAATHLAPKWMNQQMKQKQMIATIFSLIEDKLQKNDRLRQFKKQKQLKLLSVTFNNTLNFIEEYATIHQIKIPDSIPELIQIIKNETLQFGSKVEQKQFLSFKNTSPYLKRKHNKKASNILQSRNYKNGLSGSPRGRKMYNLNDRFLSPPDPQEAIRARNRSEAGISIASSRPRTTLTTRPSRPTKYFFCNKLKIEVEQRQNNFLQSSQISRDFCFAQNSKNQVQVFNFVQNQQQPRKSPKKRKYSANDKMIVNGLNNTPKKSDGNNIALSLARSMVIKNKLEDSVKFENIIPEQTTPASESSSPERQNNNRSDSPKKANPQDSNPTNYQTVKPFLNYKSVKKSMINQGMKQQIRERQYAAPRLRSSFLKNMDMKNSQIIMERSSEYASIQDMMKTITQCQIQTPLSDKCYDTFASGQRNASLFVGNVASKKGSDINISNSTADRKSGLLSSKQGGFINFASPKRNKQLQQGMFKSILVDQVRQDQVCELQQS